eukprot:scaffold158537_cov28-Tisochrysis_lutea.AAC.2
MEQVSEPRIARLPREQHLLCVGNRGGGSSDGVKGLCVVQNLKDKIVLSLRTGAVRIQKRMTVSPLHMLLAPCARQNEPCFVSPSCASGNRPNPTSLSVPGEHLEGFVPSSLSSDQANSLEPQLLRRGLRRSALCRTSVTSHPHSRLLSPPSEAQPSLSTRAASEAQPSLFTLAASEAQPSLHSCIL